MSTHPCLVISPVSYLIVSVVRNSSVAGRILVGFLVVERFSCHIEVLKIGKAALAIIVVVSCLPIVLVRSLVIVTSTVAVIGVIRSCHLCVSLPIRNLCINLENFTFLNHHRHNCHLSKPRKDRTAIQM